MAFQINDRVKLKISLSQTLREGSKGTVTDVEAGGLYDVDFDTKADGNPISPPAEESVMEDNLEAAV